MVEIESLGGSSYTQCRSSESEPTSSGPSSSSNRAESTDPPDIQSTPVCRMSQDVPHGILRTSSQPQFAGCPRTVPGCPSWDLPDIQSTPVCRMSQDYPRTSLMGSSLANPLCPDSPGMCPTLVGNTGHLSPSQVREQNILIYGSGS